jgi:hypothetical protein
MSPFAKRNGDDLLSDAPADLKAALASIDSIRDAALKLREVDPDGLFIAVFNRQIDLLAREMQASAATQILDSSPMGHTTKPLLAVMKGEDADRENSIGRFIHHFDNNDFFFHSAHSRDFFERVFQAKKNGLFSEVRRLLIEYPEPQTDGSVRSGPVTRERRFESVTRDDPWASRLIGFHMNVPGFNCRIIDVASFNARVQDEGFLAEHLDFGIYGKHYVYLSAQRPSDYLDRATGSFVAAKVEIERYVALFDYLWDHATDPKTTGFVDSCDDIESLFEGVQVRDVWRHGPTTPIDS